MGSDGVSPLEKTWGGTPRNPVGEATDVTSSDVFMAGEQVRKEQRGARKSTVSCSAAHGIGAKKPCSERAAGAPSPARAMQLTRRRTLATEANARAANLVQPDLVRKEMPQAISSGC